MSEEILINVTPQETRVALVENGMLQEVYIERERRRGIVGNICKGRVSRVLPGMEAAFVEVGLERTAFLHASDVYSLAGDERPNGDVAETISQLLQEGQQVLVQVVKDPLGTKGARLTTHITVPSRYLVFMPGARNVGVSQKIEDEAERLRLREIVHALAGATEVGGFIVRTAAEGATEEALRADMEFLRRLWASIQERAASAGPGTVVHEDLPLALRTLRDLVAAEVEKVRIDSRLTYQRALEFAGKFIPEIADRIEYYPGERPVFDLYGVEDEIQKSLQRRVQLKSGGYLIIDQPEAMTTIDVNTGAYVGHRNLEETIFKTNLEAAQAIARQLRLRNLGGIIIIDFIDMALEDHRKQVLRALEKSLERDYARSQICDVSPLGLVEMTRKRTRESLGHVLCESCPACGGRGSLKTPETVCYEIFREILRSARQFDAEKLLVLASQEVVDLLLDEESTSLAELEEFVGKPVKLQVEALYTQEQFDVVLM
ncbi:MAG: ribonuclease E/G [Chromatiales bacterium 21-64-14]|nr:MAG: ribonuclease E/G [Chromatiales bacterium 21-64-14]HQU14962.1 ribonuclease G [Gammaproteobacteria bacterium]